MARLQRPSRQRSSASDSNFRRRKEEWPACSGRSSNELTRPILIFVAAKKNGPPADRRYATAALIRDFMPKLENRCKVLPGNAIFRALILDFRPRLGNRCMVLPGNAIFRASILDFRPRLGNHCSIVVAAVGNGPPAALSLRL